MASAGAGDVLEELVPVQAATLPRWVDLYTKDKAATDKQEAQELLAAEKAGKDDASKKDKEGDDGEDKNAKDAAPFFTVNDKVNEKMVLWKGDILCLDTDAVVNSTNERLNDKTGISKRVFALGGQSLVNQCIAVEGCPTGDAVLTRSVNLTSPNIIHTVGPRWSEKYQTAAENALHGCYRRSLEVLKEEKLSSIAFCIVNTDRKGYPKKDAAHVALRTVRRFLDKYGEGVDMVVFAVEESDDANWQIYNEAFPLYFPRSNDEAIASKPLMPHNMVINELGEKVIAERQIRLTAGYMSMPKARGAEVDPSTVSNKRNIRKAIAPDSDFALAQENPDERRRREDAAKPAAQLAAEESARRYNLYLRRARDEDLSDLAELNFIYQSGVDSQNRPILVFVASHLPAQSASLDRVLLYLIKVLDPIVSKDYNLIYFHTHLSSQNKPPFPWLKEVYSIFNRKYKKNMKRLFIVHPNFWVKTLFFFAKPFVSSKFWKKLTYIPKLMDLYLHFDPQTLRIPSKILQYDQDEFPASYTAAYAAEQEAKSEDAKL